MAMKSTTSRSLCALTTALLLAAALPAHAKIVCWKNRDGVRECGNVVPPEYAQQSTERKSGMGLTVEKTERAKTAQELERERAEVARQKQEEAERRRIAAEQARRDRVLLRTFATVEDLELTRDGKVAAIDSRIRHSEQLVERLRENIDAMYGEAAALERSGKPVSDELAGRIREAQTQIDETLAEIERREDERVEVRQRFDDDLVRFRELKGS
jgi:hypothetical protein